MKTLISYQGLIAPTSDSGFHTGPRRWSCLVLLLIPLGQNGEEVCQERKIPSRKMFLNYEYLASCRMSLCPPNQSSTGFLESNKSFAIMKIPQM